MIYEIRKKSGDKCPQKRMDGWTDRRIDILKTIELCQRMGALIHIEPYCTSSELFAIRLFFDGLVRLLSAVMSINLSK